MRKAWLRWSLLPPLILSQLACGANPGGPDASAVVKASEAAKRANAPGKPGKPANTRQRSAID